MVKPNQPKNKPDKERAQDLRDDLDLPPLTPEEEAYEKACDAIVDARLVSKFGPKSKFTDELTRRTEQRAARLHTTKFSHSLLEKCTAFKALSPLRFQRKQPS